MYLTLDILERFGACDSGKKWFARYFPNGGELIDIISHKYATPEILHWGFHNFTTTPEEQEAYWVRLNVNVPNRCTIYESDNITDSCYVSRSSNITNSNFVFSSAEVSNSNDIMGSQTVEDSNQVFISEFVYGSNKVYYGKNITESTNIVNSDYVVRSRSVMNSAVVTDSCFVSALDSGRTKNIKNSAFIYECINMKRCMFCSGIDNGENLLFNKPIDADELDLIMKQLKSVLGDYSADYVRDGEWSGKEIPLKTPQIEHNLISQYSKLSEKFWRWVATLPNYDSQILYTIIWQARLLTN